MGKTWSIYNHCLLCTLPPHNCPPPMDKITPWYLLKNNLLLARWIDCWDSTKETEWWHCIKDDAYEIDSLKAKRRYEIKRGSKNFNVRIINPEKYTKEIYEVFCQAYTDYPILYRPTITIEQIVNACISWKKNIFIGGFNHNNELCGCAVLIDDKDYVDFSMLRIKPEFQHDGINFAIVNFICDWMMQHKRYIYITDGERNIRHITAFQDFLIKYFGFRKAYCRLNIMYNPLVKILILGMFPFKALFARIGNQNTLVYNFYCLLKQEEIRRSFL
ncbi:MAG: hypothetical protein PHQ45_02335 [Acidaminococcaceae bacterium]|nr:hypothetical protein [Acidaminococcaceae bacterium]